jgi:SAM-dependent methyltransferase
MSLDAETTSKGTWGPEALQVGRQERREFQERIAPRREHWITSNRYYYDRLKRLLRFIVEPHKRVLEVRCQTGHLLAAVDPSQGVGIEISQKLVWVAQAKHPRLRFLTGDPEELDLKEEFDYVIFNHIFDMVDILSALDKARHHCTEEARLVVINYNQLWQPAAEWASKLGLRAPCLKPNWINEQDLRGFLDLAGFKVVRVHKLFLFPKWIPLLSWMLNDVLARLPVFRRLCLLDVVVARPVPQPKSCEDVTVSVVVPCRNEEGNIRAAVQRIPEMGKHTEIIFGDDRSTDGTVDEIRHMQAMYPDRDIRLVYSPGICKAENVWKCFNAARGDILMILDADLTVMPEELPFFLRAILRGNGEFINGSRLVYPVAEEAMKTANRVGNKVFSLIFSFLLDQRIKDTLCGTKVLWRKDWNRIAPYLGSWGLKDLWGDYELLFGASRLQLQMAEVPVHYQERAYGVTKMTRVLRNGLRMLGICWFGWRRLSG